MALAAELLLSGLPASKQLPRDGSNMCEMCKKAESRYKCPGCLVQTCGLECCRLHKQKLGCDGRRDETVFKPISQFDDKALVSDYLFLERISRKVNSTNRGFRKFRLELRPQWVSNLVRACYRRCVNLRIVAPNMSRGFVNKTCFIPKRDVIMWQIEWLFPSINKKYVQTSVYEYDRVPNVLFTLLTTNLVVLPVLRRYKMEYSSPCKPEVEEHDSTAETTSNQQQVDKCSLTFLLRLKPNKHSFDRWRVVEKEKTLASNLRYQCIVEFPTIVVLLPTESPQPYLTQNGKVPDWIKSRPGAAQSDRKVDEVKEEGEISDDESSTSSSSDDETDLISDTTSEDDCKPSCSKRARLSNDSPVLNTFSKIQPLVAYGTSDEEEESDGD